MLLGRDVLTLADLDSNEVRVVLDRSLKLKSAWKAGSRSTPLAGRSAALIFLKPSLRTRVSFEVACRRLGIDPVVLGPGDAFSRSETVADTTRTLDRYVDAIVLRTFEHAQVEEVAHYAQTPVINALSDDFHPCQALADLLTMKERFETLAGLEVAYIGDGNNVCASLMLAAAHAGMRLRIATPSGYGPRQDVVEMAQALAARSGADIELLEDPASAVLGASVVYTDTWTSMGQEEEHAARIEAFKGFTVDAALMSRAAKDAVFMHCLPAHRGEEVTDEVIDGPASVVFDQAENRLHAQMALLSLVVK